jgi:predicted lipase
MKDFYFSNEDDEQEFLKNQKWLIHSLIVESVKKAYSEGLENIVVFRIINPINNFIMKSELNKCDWVESLSKSLSYYESVEEYENCGEIKELIKRIKDDTNRSNKGEKEN